MKKPLILLTVLASILFSCVEEPFDNTLLETEYWRMFSASMELVAFDNLATSAQGYQRFGDTNYYFYTSDLLDLETHDRLFLLHSRENNLITYSMIDTTYFTPQDIRPKIEWIVTEQGIVEGCMKYDLEGMLLQREEYDIVINPSITEIENGIMYQGELLYITEKRKYDKNDVLFETITYPKNPL